MSVGRSETILCFYTCTWNDGLCKLLRSGAAGNPQSCGFCWKGQLREVCLGMFGVGQQKGGFKGLQGNVNIY